MTLKSFLTHSLIFFSFLLFVNCRNNKNKEKLKVIIPLCNQHLFVEKYEVYGGGAHGGDMISAYLTDSINFREYLRTYDNAKETIAFECIGKDSLKVLKQLLDTATNKYIVVNDTVYNILELKQKKVFD